MYRRCMAQQFGKTLRSALFGALKCMIGTDGPNNGMKQAALRPAVDDPR